MDPSSDDQRDVDVHGFAVDYVECQGFGQYDLRSAHAPVNECYIDGIQQTGIEGEPQPQFRRCPLYHAIFDTQSLLTEIRKNGVKWIKKGVSQLKVRVVLEIDELSSVVFA